MSGPNTADTAGTADTVSVVDSADTADSGISEDSNGGNENQPPHELGWFELYDGVQYPVDDPDHAVDHYGDPDSYWYEPSGDHGRGTDVLRSYIRTEGAQIYPEAPISVYDDASEVVAFREVTFTYWLCVFAVDYADDPSAWTASVSSVDDGMILFLNGEPLDALTLDGSGSWSLAEEIVVGETNIFAAILVDNSRGGRIVSELSLERDGAFVEE